MKMVYHCKGKKTRVGEQKTTEEIEVRMEKLSKIMSYIPQLSFKKFMDADHLTNKYSKVKMFKID